MLIFFYCRKNIKMWFFARILFFIFVLFKSNISAIEEPPKPKIIGGHDTSITVVPWQLLNFRNESQNCGAVIIGPRDVITAGHCFMLGGEYPSFHQYRSGSDLLLSGGTNHTVEYFVVHPEYNLTDDYITHDIAFVRVNEPFEFSESTQPIKIAEIEPTGGEEALISGFGIRRYDINSPDNITIEFATVLQSVVLPVVDRKTCQEWYSDFFWAVRDDQICVGVEEGGLGSCYGDSGGPLVVNNELVGVTSWGAPCATPHHPSVYTSVVRYREWIEEQLNSTMYNIN